MQKRIVNYKAVDKAAHRIKSRGEEPSLTNICKALGLIKAPPELSHYLERWYHSQPEFQRTIEMPLSQNLRIKTEKVLKKNIELEKSLSLLRATLESTADGIMMVNGEGKVVDWNQKFVEMWRIPSHMLESGTEKIGFDYILQQVSDPEALIADVQFLYANPEWQGALPFLHFKDGRIFERFTQPQKVGHEIVGRVYSFRDVTQQLIEQEALRIRERAIEASTHGVGIIEIQGKDFLMIYVNKSFERITGYMEKDILGKDLTLLQNKKKEDVNLKRIQLAMREEKDEVVEIEGMKKNGELYWCEISVAPVRDQFLIVKHYVVLINDITQRRRMEAQLIEQATHDSLTDLPNRILLSDRIEQSILKAKKYQKEFAFLFLDLDRFKLINDTLGHSIGDKLLQSVANRLIKLTTDLDTVARLGGDEFVILVEDMKTRAEIETLAQKILLEIDKPFRILQHTLKISASIGISIFPRDGIDYETLMKNADVSMYHAKDNGRNAYCVFEAQMNEALTTRVQLENALRDALSKQEFSLAYQPLFELHNNRISGFEALIRWHSHLLGEVPPIDFIQICEENGMILEVGKWVLEEACMELSQWHRKGYSDLTIAVNLSGRQFRDPNLFNTIEKVLYKAGLPASALELELTESLLIENLETAIQTMKRLTSLGIQLVIDDFGTGYSSLSYLRLFPVKQLKIDRSFIKDIPDNQHDTAIVSAIINLGHSLNLKVLAEGIETPKQQEFLITSGCDLAQGYLLCYPLKSKELQKFVSSYRAF